MHPHVELFVGGGTVVNLQTLLEELAALDAIGIDTSRLKISDRAHVVLPSHVERDRPARRRGRTPSARPAAASAQPT